MNALPSPNSGFAKPGALNVVPRSFKSYIDRNGNRLDAPTLDRRSFGYDEKMGWLGRGSEQRYQQAQNAATQRYRNRITEDRIAAGQAKKKRAAKMRSLMDGMLSKMGGGYQMQKG